MIGSMAILAMRPDALVRFGHATYSRRDQVPDWTDPRWTGQGLSVTERELLSRLPFPGGELLLLGIGTGREVPELAARGFRITGIDFVEEYVRLAVENARRNGFAVTGRVADISRAELPVQAFQTVWFSHAMYSVVPTRKRRVAMLRRIRSALVDDGLLVCQFHMDPAVHRGPIHILLRRIAGGLMLGNTAYESGDFLWRDSEFLHAFRDFKDVEGELNQAGFRAIHFVTDAGKQRCGIIAEKTGVSGRAGAA